MTFPTFQPARPPSNRSKTSTTPKVASVSYGDGYDDVRPAGINSMLETVTAVWVQPDIAAVDAMEAFFTARKGAEPFWYQFPWSTTVKLWRATTWGRDFQDDPHEVYTVTFKEVPPP